MLEKGEISFIFLWVLNPIMILFFQNCSMVPSTATADPTPQFVEGRMPACHGIQAGNCSVPN